MLSDKFKFSRLIINHAPEEDGEYLPTYKFKNRNTVVGIEVELENVTKIGTGIKTNWNIVDDGSLKYFGKEFTSKPVKCQYSEYVLNNLYSNLNKDVAVSHRTSVHLHVNFRKSSFEDIAKFLLLYSVFEPLLYKYVGYNRKDNVFCVPLNKTWYYRKVSDLIKDPKSLLNISWSKYSGVNIAPLADGRGTIEFRQLARTKNVDTICVWIDTILTLKKKASEYSLNHLIDEISQLLYSSQYDQFFWKILGEEIGQAFIALAKEELQISKDVREGVLFARQCIYFKEDPFEINGWKEFAKSPFGLKIGFIYKDIGKISPRVSNNPDYYNF